MDFHFEFVKVEPMPGLLWVKVMVAVSRCKAKTVEPEVRGQQQTGWTLLIGYTRVATLPPPVRKTGRNVGSDMGRGVIRTYKNFRIQIS